MIKIEYPQVQFRIKKEKNKERIFDEVRQKWVALTPEEWIRQNFIQYLLKVENYPKALLSIEKIIQLGELKKRCDIVIYKNNQPWMIVECKEMKEDLGLPVLEQIVRYNLSYKVSFLVITNGLFTQAFELSSNGIIELKQLPKF